MRLDDRGDEPRERSAISSLRNRLLGEHLGLSVEAVDAFLANDPSLVRLVDSRQAASRCLRDLPTDDAARRVVERGPRRSVTADHRGAW